MSWDDGIHVTTKAEMRSVNKKGEKTSGYQRVQRIQFVTLFSAGFNRDHITQLMELKPNEYDKLFSDMYTEAQQEIGSQSTAKAYAQYVIRQTELLRNLEKFKGKISGSKGNIQDKVAQSYLGAIKAQSDIGHKILMTGVQLGILSKKDGKTIQVDGYDPRDMDENQLGETLQKELMEAQKLSNKGKKKRTAKIFVLPTPKTGTEDE